MKIEILMHEICSYMQYALNKKKKVAQFEWKIIEILYFEVLSRFLTVVSMHRNYSCYTLTGMHFKHTVLSMACKVESNKSADLQRGMHKWKQVLRLKIQETD